MTRSPRFIVQYNTESIVTHVEWRHTLILGITLKIKLCKTLIALSLFTGTLITLRKWPCWLIFENSKSILPSFMIQNLIKKKTSCMFHLLTCMGVRLSCMYVLCCSFEWWLLTLPPGYALKDRWKVLSACFAEHSSNQLHQQKFPSWVGHSVHNTSSCLFSPHHQDTRQKCNSDLVKPFACSHKLTCTVLVIVGDTLDIHFTAWQLWQLWQTTWA